MAIFLITEKSGRQSNGGNKLNSSCLSTFFGLSVSVYIRVVSRKSDRVTRVISICILFHLIQPAFLPPE